jgi:hypothetical protein
MQMASGLRLVVRVTSPQHNGIGRQTLMRLLAVSLLLALTPACSKQLSVLSSGATSNPKHELPFDRIADGNGVSPTEALASVTVPAGTPIEVVLDSALSSASAHPGDIFEATLDEPIMLRGHMLVSRGTAVTGRVVFAKASDTRHPGYLRITLSGMTLHGKILDLHTSGIFAKGTGDTRHPGANLPSHASFPSGSQKQSLLSVEAKFSTARRLTFRLTQPVNVSPPDLPKMAFAH